MLEFHHDKVIGLLKLGWTLTKQANICLHGSASGKFYPFTENHKSLLTKLHGDIVRWPSKRLKVKRLLTRPRPTCLRVFANQLLE